MSRGLTPAQAVEAATALSKRDDLPGDMQGHAASFAARLERDGADGRDVDVHAFGLLDLATSYGVELEGGSAKSVTKKDLQAELDRRGVAYDAKATKAELEQLLADAE